MPNKERSLGMPSDTGLRPGCHPETLKNWVAGGGIVQPRTESRLGFPENSQSDAGFLKLCSAYNHKAMLLILSRKESGTELSSSERGQDKPGPGQDKH